MNRRGRAIAGHGGSPPRSTIVRYDTFEPAGRDMPFRPRRTDRRGVAGTRAKVPPSAIRRDATIASAQENEAIRSDRQLKTTMRSRAPGPGEIRAAGAAPSSRVDSPQSEAQPQRQGYATTGAKANAVDRRDGCDEKGLRTIPADRAPGHRADGDPAPDGKRLPAAETVVQGPETGGGDPSRRLLPFRQASQPARAITGGGATGAGLAEEDSRSPSSVAGL